jgi:hypothetical protein
LDISRIVIDKLYEMGLSWMYKNVIDGKWNVV